MPKGRAKPKSPPPKRMANGSEIGPGAQIQVRTVLHFGRVVFRPRARIRGHSVHPRPPIRRHSGPRGVARSSPKSLFLAAPRLRKTRKLQIVPCLRRPSENAVRNFAIVEPSQRRYADSTGKWAVAASRQRDYTPGPEERGNLGPVGVRGGAKRALYFWVLGLRKTKSVS